MRPGRDAIKYQPAGDECTDDDDLDQRANSMLVYRSIWLSGVVVSPNPGHPTVFHYDILKGSTP